MWGLLKAVLKDWEALLKNKMSLKTKNGEETEEERRALPMGPPAIWTRRDSILFLFFYDIQLWKTIKVSLTLELSFFIGFIHNVGSQRNVRVLKKNMIFLQSYDEQIPTSTLKLNSTFTPAGPVLSVKAKQNFRNTTTYVTYSS